MSSFYAKVFQQMATTGKSFRRCCQESGAAGGRATARNKRRARESREKFHMEQERQAAMKLRDADEVFTEQDRASIAFDQRRVK